MLNKECNQREEDRRRGRNADENPYRYETWYKENMSQFPDDHEGKHADTNWDKDGDDFDLSGLFGGADESVYVLGAKTTIFSASLAGLF